MIESTSITPLKAMPRTVEDVDRFFYDAGFVQILRFFRQPEILYKNCLLTLVSK